MSFRVLILLLAGLAYLSIFADAERVYRCTCESFETLTSVHESNKFTLQKGRSIDAGVAWFCAFWDLDSGKCLALHEEMQVRAKPECCDIFHIPATQPTNAFFSWIMAHGFLQKEISVKINSVGIPGLFMATETRLNELLFAAPTWSEHVALRSPVFGRYVCIV